MGIALLSQHSLRNFAHKNYRLFYRFFLTTMCSITLLSGVSGAYAADKASLQVQFETDFGNMIIELYPDKAPKTVENFLAYVDSGFYDGTIFHRVVTDFVVQGGGFTYDFKRKETKPPVVNESDNGLKNLEATLSMARTDHPDSATSQFFINLRNNPNLDPQNGRPGYAVFGKVIKGFEIAQKIEKEPRGLYRAFPEAPNYPVRILKATRFAPSKK